MKINDRVKTCYGEGTIISKEAETGFLSKCFLVKLDNCPENLEYIQNKQGGLNFVDIELEVIK